MSPSADLSYTPQELLDYLPGGWVLTDPLDAGSWNAKRGRWEVAVRDIADVEWDLRIDGKSAARDGRVEALKAAMDQLFRAALGKSSWLG